MWWTRVFLLGGCILLGLAVNAQTFGNEWINYEQSYYKIKIAKDGVYKVTADELAIAGVPVANIAVNRYQLFRRGEEVAIATQDTNNDGRLDSFEFYGKKSDGKADTELYVSPEAQPHTYYNLFSDTATYFLTWHLTNTSGKRMEFSSIKDATGLTATPYHTDSQLKLQVGTYATGLRYGSTNEILSARYDYGEGWTGSNISKNASNTFNYTLSNVETTGPKPVLELVLTGVSSFEHVVDIRVGRNTNNLRTLATVTFDARYHKYYSGALEWSDVGTSGELMVQVTPKGLSGQTDVISVSYVKVDYAQKFNHTSGAKTYNIGSTGAQRGYVKVPTSVASSLRVFDITNPVAPKSLATTAFSDRLEFVFPDLTIDRVLHAFEAPAAVPSISKATLTPLGVTSANYLLVTHPQLDQLVDGMNPVTAYVNYRKSSAGGGYDVLKVEISSLFDQFNYGDPSPLAIRNFVGYALNSGAPQYLFLIGKGTTVNHKYYRNNPQTTSLTHYVPTFGYPGSDLLFSVDTQAGNLAPQVATGRLNALNSGDVKAYLDKVMEMEAVPYDQLWRKNLIHLSGGQTAGELRSFENYILNFKSIAERDFLGGKASNINKNSTDAVKVINVAQEVNQGVSLITFFGHSSSIVTDIEIGRASNPADGYTNKGKYPVILVNGCNAGEIFTTSLTFGEDWMRTPNAGALAVMANSDFALSSSLKRWSDLFYQFAFATDETFGRSLGELTKLVSERFLEVYGTGGTEQSQVYQTVLQGDPAVKVFGAQSPDYEIQTLETYASAFGQERVLSNADSFQINIPVRNYGRSVKDSLKITIQRTFPDGSQETVSRYFERVLRQDTLSFTLYNDLESSNEGTNTFLIQLDPDNDVTELNEGNNTSNFELFIPKGNTIPLYPVDYSIVAEPVTRLLWQSANQLEQNRVYSLMVDTTATYNSPFLKNESLEGGLLMSYPLDLTSAPDSTTVYWRTRFSQARDNEDTSWVESSFTLVNDAAEGWAQVGAYQFEKDPLHGVSYDVNSKKLSFQETKTGIQINTHGVDSPNEYVDYQVIVDGINLLLTDNAADPTCKRLNAINAVVFDKESAQPYRPFGFLGTDVYDDLVCGRLPQMIHNFNESQVLGSTRYLDSIVSVIDNGDVVLLFSFDYVAFSKWDAQIKSSLNNIGIANATIEGLTDGQPVIFLGRKGDPVGSAVVVTSDGSAVPLKSQAIELVGLVTGKFTSGNLSSTLIGPAKRWQSFHYEVDGEPNDSWQFSVTGVSPTGQKDLIFSGSRSTEIDVSELDADLYPYMTLNFAFADDADQTPPNLRSWGVNYGYPAEGILVPEDYEIKEVAEGAGFSRNYLFTNISNAEFTDSLNVQVAVTNVTSGNRESENYRVAAPAPGDTTRIEVTKNTRGRTGYNNVLVSVQAPETELYTVNNMVNQLNALLVTEDKINPVLDVTFDGGYILDGDIVSPTPSILIRFKDDNEFLYKDDTSGITIELKSPCEACDYERVSFANPKVTYTPSSESEDFEINYMPGPLEDGVYALRVQGTDESGNKSGEYPYEISFEVINESTITHFYPYPNPFSTQTRFVFTLTGSTMPDRIKIQIMTVTGRVVREITQDEIGPLRIGNNITQYAWDGRDEYGDQLANGVYLYKVFIRQNGEQIEHRNTNADRAFKHGFGKLYILR